MSKRETREASALLRITVINKTKALHAYEVRSRVACVRARARGRSGHRLEDSSRVFARVCVRVYVCQYTVRAKLSLHMQMRYFEFRMEFQYRFGLLITDGWESSRPKEIERSRINNVYKFISKEGIYIGITSYVVTRNEQRHCLFRNLKRNKIFLYLYCETRLAVLDLWRIDLVLYYLIQCSTKIIMYNIYARILAVMLINQGRPLISE